MDVTYVHGYEAAENVRLHDQAATLAALLHTDTLFGGVTGTRGRVRRRRADDDLASNNPGASFMSIDISQVSVDRTREAVAEAGGTNVDLLSADIFDLPFGESWFNHVFVCFVLEHLDRPVEALANVRRVLEARREAHHYRRRSRLDVLSSETRVRRTRGAVPSRAAGARER